MPHVRLNAQELRVVWDGYSVYLAELCRRPIEIARYAMVSVVVQLTEDKFAHVGQLIGSSSHNGKKKSTTPEGIAHKCEKT